ncbi:MAG TPA: IS21 family transposase [Gaiellaceae bacterium]|nr:IS21 family transposase [Gaiellaceae bacterium]
MAKRLTMKKIREILRQKWVLGSSHRDVARSLGVSVGAVSSAVARATHAGLTWSDVEALGEVELEHRLFGGEVEPGASRPLPNFQYVHAERRRPGVTLDLLHLEYLQEHPDGYRYTRFCDLYREWLGRRGLTMRQVYIAGEHTFVDYSGKKPCIVDRDTGEVTEVELFVAVLGASNYTYAEATRTQQSPEWIRSHTNAVEYFGGVTRAFTPDQLKSGVTKSCWYEPTIQRTYQDWAEYYGTAIVPARPGKPKDKAKVENGVLIAQRWILACLRNETFYSIAELNVRIAELLERLNTRTMRHYGASRRELFERLDKPAMRPLRRERYEYAEWAEAGVGPNYHVLVGHHHYSVPHSLYRERLDVRTTATTVEVFFKGRRITSHVRSYVRNGYTTKKEHMPKAHQKHLEWTPTRMVSWGQSVGPNTAALITAILADRPHPEQGYKSCLGILRLGKKYGNERLEAACGRAHTSGARSYRHVDSILKRGLDRMPLDSRDDEPQPLHHENIRGPETYR